MLYAALCLKYVGYNVGGKICFIEVSIFHGMIVQLSTLLSSQDNSLSPCKNAIVYTNSYWLIALTLLVNFDRALIIA